MTDQKLDPREEHFTIAGPRAGLNLFLRHLAPAASRPDSHNVVLYVHGATFPSALSIAHRFDGRSWRDELCEAGFKVWGLDFYGYGFSARYPEMQQPPDQHPPLGTTEDATEQIASAVKFICERQQVRCVSMIAHSWGTMPALRYAGDHPSRVSRLVLFAPIVLRLAPEKPEQDEEALNRRAAGGGSRVSQRAALPAWRTVTLNEQWTRFIEDVPATEAPVLSRIHFDEWGERYLDSEAASRSRQAASVQVPGGPLSDIARIWSGAQVYDPGRVRAPVCLLRGEWDRVTTRADTQNLFDALTASVHKRDITLSRGTHLMHLESGRHALHRESICFLSGED